MSLIPNLGSLGPIGKLLDPGALVKDVVNGVLPKNMGVVGDLAGAFVDFKMGNPIGGVQHAMEALHDLPQAAKGTQPGGAAGNDAVGLLNRKPELEPSPPPLASRDGKPFDLNDLLSAIKALTAALAAHGTSATPGAPATSTSGTGTPKPDAPVSASDPSVTASRESTVASTDGDATSRRRSSSTATAGTASAVQTAAGETSGWRAEPRTPAPPASAGTHSGWRGEPRTAPATSNGASPSTVASSSNGASPSTVASSSNGAPAATAAPQADASSAGGGQTITSVSQLQGMSDGAFKDAVRNGRISPDVAKDQVAMMAIQERMNSVTQMNNLMTAMMRALHDMQMAIIQNIRI